MKIFPSVFRRIVVSSVLLAVISGIPAAVVAHERSAGGYLGRSDVSEFIDELTKESNFSRQELEQLIGRAERSERALELISKPAEGTLQWKDYRKIFLTPERIAKGVAFWEKNANTLNAVEKELKVPASIIVAIIGVETYYGRQTGGFRVIDALTTLGFDFPKRSKFFRQELKNFLLLVQEQNLNIDELTGSYAGAMGIPQFMPSSYRAYALDYTGDQQANIWRNDADAIASVANYLQQHGWKYGNHIAFEATVSGKGYAKVISSGLQPDKRLIQVQKAGWSVSGSIPKSAKVLPMRHEGSAGPEYWLGLHNFYVITRYNRSQMYALAVYQLAREIKADYNRTLAKRSDSEKGNKG